MVSTIRDITARRESTADLQRLATTDPLTGVANRTLLMDRLGQGLRRLGRGGGVLVVLYVDLDRFKRLNDSLGHRVGDEVLLQIAGRLNRHVRPPDTLARLGGDEFVVVVEDAADEAAAVELGNRLINAGRKPMRIGNEEVTCTLSVGIASTGDSRRDPDELLQEADLALYRAKGWGRDRAEVFDEGLRTKAVDRLRTERMLRRAVDEKQLVIEYQPIMDLRTRDMVAAEALVRVRDDELGLLRPASFIEVAEETGLLMTIDEHVLNEAVVLAAGWHGRSVDGTAPGVAVNVTGRQMASARFPETVIDLLDARGLPHGCLQLELTERALMEASRSALSGLRMLRDAGVKVGLDDFGTGYSSLAYLRQFPLDFVKIDQSFVAQLNGGGAERSIVAAIVWLSHALDLTVIAEGVETPRQLHAVEELGCDRAQGFVFGEPVEPSSLDDFLGEEPDATAVS